ncbi:MAG: hypothetical protein ACMUIL_08360 [bacterium]
MKRNNIQYIILVMTIFLYFPAFVATLYDYAVGPFLIALAGISTVILAIVMLLR